MNIKSKRHAGRCSSAPIQQLNRPAGNIFTALHYKAYKKSEQPHMTSESSIREIEVTFKWIHPCRVTEGWNLSQYALCEMEVVPSKGHRAKTDNTFTQQKCHLIRTACGTSPKKRYANPPHTVGSGSNRRPSCHDVIHHGSQIHMKC